MASLLSQLESLKKQQAALVEKIKEEEDRNEKLSKEASIGRLEALIQPITQHLNRSGEPGRHCPSAETPTLREIFEDERKRFKSGVTGGDLGGHPRINILTNEEIFVTLLGIIKKQDARIEQLEKGNKADNTHLKRASTIEFSDLQMMKRY